MSTPKTQRTDADVRTFLAAVEPAARREDSFILLDLFTSVTGMQAALWGTSIVGFGSYHYASERSRQEGDWPLTAFSPRKAALSVYIMPGFSTYGSMLKRLGKYTTGSSCLYIKRLSDIDLDVLRELVTISVHDMQQRYTTSS